MRVTDATWSGQAYALLPAGDPLLIDPDAPDNKPAATPTPERINK